MLQLSSDQKNDPCRLELGFSAFDSKPIELYFDFDHLPMKICREERSLIERLGYLRGSSEFRLKVLQSSILCVTKGLLEQSVK